MFKTTLIAAALSTAALAAQADTLALWDFNAETTEPSSGAGTLSTIGGVSTSYAAGPLGNLAGDRALNTANFPTASASPLTAGIEFSISAVGFENISLSYDGRHSGTASKYETVLVSTGGAAFVTLASFSYADTLFAARTVDLSALAAADNAALTFRIVSDFAPSTSSYAGTASGYSVNGTMRFDNVTISGTAIAAVPEPGTYALLLAGLGLVGVAARRRRA